ncbi:TetR/AcrR family transcriptional regulator [Noviherbaspirillum denitrificans]|uniref:TetR family transcriptional regulator n=1 Tax=Noviherbaspirillum denitrificans TaxID=1968433 RepID=A0A254TSG0_9BURK|nr:TetR/AcrR family transcriptional regulator [Noviherbaspirillum denitrificans]OWW22668.1 TetR family transcriptional regulator [Noviherbaspirillum denitrificans]
MPSLYRRRPAVGFGKSAGPDAAGKTRIKPLKRPRQARAKFTVQAIYDTFVRIWRAAGWQGVTTRAVAMESGVSIGTLYEYFPNKEALLSGYVRHCVEVLLDAIETEVIRPAGLAWEERVDRLVRVTGSLGTGSQPYFDAAMLQLENVIAEPKHHRRVFEELSDKWIKAVDACTDLPARPDPAAVRNLFALVWGGKRYLLLLDADDAAQARWSDDTAQMCVAWLHLRSAR